MSPLRSRAQRRYLYAKHRELAEEFERRTAKGKRLPERVAGRGKKARRGK